MVHSFARVPSPLRFGAGALVAVALTGAARNAFAAPCSSLPDPVYGLGGSATKPFLGKVAAALTKAGYAHTLVYQSPGACLGINALLADTKITGTASYWDADGKEQTCDLPLTGQAVDFANMGNSATSCPGVSQLPAGVGDFEGAVQPFTLIVPTASTQQSISREAAYLAFGLGAGGQAAPWIDEAQIFRRDANSAAQLFIAIATGVPAGKFKGVDTKNNAGTVTAVSSSTSPEAAIGLVSGEVADANRATVRILAYQHTGQTCGYWPDSSVTSFDKRNVRTGQYYVWSPTHYFAKVDASGKPADPKVKDLLGILTTEAAAPTGVDINQLAIKAGSVPKCAMEVQRKGDLGEISSYAPAAPCGCFYESVATGTTSCTACTKDAECTGSATHCRFGFCEVN